MPGTESFVYDKFAMKNLREDLKLQKFTDFIFNLEDDKDPKIIELNLSYQRGLISERSCHAKKLKLVKPIAVHKVVLACASPYFEALFQQWFSEYTFEDVSYENFKNFVRTIYGEDLELDVNGLIGLHGLAMKTGILMLQENARKKMIGLMDEKNITDLVYAANLTNDSALKEACEKFSMENSQFFIEYFY